MLKIGVIGCGAIGKEHIKRLCGKLQGAAVTAVYDVDEAAARAAAELCGAEICTDEQSLIESKDVDAIVITSPGFAHVEAVLLSIAAGKPVFTEKPLATTADDCRRIVEREMAGGKQLVQVGFMRRYDRGYRQIKEMVDSKNLGSPLMLHCTHRNPEVGTNYNTPMAVYDTAIHEIDVLHWLVDDEYETVQVLTPGSTKHTHAELKDPQIMLMRTKRGICIDVEVFVNCKYGYDINCEIVCEEGVIKMAPPSEPILKSAGRLSTGIETSWINRFIDSYDIELQEWLEATAKGVVNGPSAWDGYVAAVTADALVKAQQTGGVVSVNTGEKPEFYN